VPKKIRQLIQDLKKAGYVDRGGKGSHRNFTLEGLPTVTLSGKTGDDAKRYQKRSVFTAVDAAEEQEKASEEENQS